MSRKYAQKSGNKDRNHDEIANNLKSMGWHVSDVSKVPDFIDIVASKNYTVLVEVKHPNGLVGMSQLKFIAEFPGFICFVQSLQDCKALTTNPLEYCLSKKRKAEIYAYYRKTVSKLKNGDRARQSVSVIEKAIGKL